MGSQSHYSNLVSSQTSSPVESTGTSSQKGDVIIFILKEQKMKKKINVDLLGMYQYHVFLQKKPQNNFFFFFWKLRLMYLSGFIYTPDTVDINIKTAFQFSEQPVNINPSYNEQKKKNHIIVSTQKMPLQKVLTVHLLPHKLEHSLVVCVTYSQNWAFWFQISGNCVWGSLFTLLDTWQGQPLSLI